MTRTGKTRKWIRFLTAAMVLALLFAFLAVPAGAENRSGLVVEKLTFRDVLRQYTVDRASFGTNALQTDDKGVTNAAKNLAEMFTFTVGLNYTGQGNNGNYFGKDITAKMGTEPYVDENLQATYSVEIYPYQSYATALPEGKTTAIRVYFIGYVNAASGVEPVLHYVWNDRGTWYAVKDDNPYYKVSYNGQSALQAGGVTLVRSRTVNGTAELESWTDLSQAPEGSGVVHLSGSTLVAGQGGSNVFGVTTDMNALALTGGLSANLSAVSDFVQGDTNRRTGPLVFSRECYEDGTMHRVPDGEALKAGVTYRFRVVYDEALCMAAGSSWGEAGITVRSEVTGQSKTITDFTWYGDSDYLTNDKYNPHTVEFTFTPSGEGDGVCTFSLKNLVGSETSMKAADFHTCTATGRVIVETAPAANTVPATTAVPASEPAAPAPAATAAPAPTAAPTAAPAAPAAETTPAPAATPAATTEATTLPLLIAGGEYAVVTRGMLAESLWMLYGRPAVNTVQPFADLPLDSARRQAVAWVTGTGIIQPLNAGVFGVDMPVTREQVAVVLQRFASLCGADIGAAGDLSQWSDGDAVSAWAQQSVIWALRTGTLVPRSDGRLAPGENALCGEVTGMIFRLEQLF